MFIIEITYKKTIEYIELYLADHRAFLDNGYLNNYFIVSGPKHPRTGGIIISPLTDLNMLERILKEDPFKVNDVAEYTIIEFNPTKYHANLANCLTDIIT